MNFRTDASMMLITPENSRFPRMTTRRDFFRLAAETATLAMLPGRSLAAEQNHRPHETTRGIQRGRPLRDLQQQFVDLRFGMFLHFNITPDKVRLVKDQLTELFTNYGEIDVLITDGWNAPWSRITYEEMPFREIYEHIKALQPNCLISDLNASQFPSGGLYYSDIKAFEQNAGQKVPQQSDLPAISCVTITPEWFWKQRDVYGDLKPTATVVDEWLVPLNSRHCNLILNAPPTREGRLAPNVISRLQEIGRAWKHPGPAGRISEHAVITTPNLATAKPIHASSYPEGSGPDEANDGSFQSSWYLDEGLTSGWLEVDLMKEHSFNVVSLVEPVGRGDDYKMSRIKSYRFQRWDGANWVTLMEGGLPTTTIHRIPRVTARRVRLAFESSHDKPHIADIGVYDEPS